MKVDVIELSNGVKMPIIGLGTWQSKPGEVEAAVRIALDVGYRHIDTAKAYGNEVEIGKVLKEYFSDGKLKREDVFVTTKLANEDNRRESVESALQESLKRLQLEYVDLYLIHGPISFKADGSGPDPSVRVTDTWKGMESVYEKKLARAIGVSNFSAEQIERIQAVAKVPIHNQQVELHLHFPQFHLQDVCRKHSISLTAYAPIGSPGRPASLQKNDAAPLQNPLVLQLSEKHHKSPAEILLRHLIQRGIIVIPKSTNASRIKENFDVFDFKLSDEEVDRLNNIGGPQIRMFTSDVGKGHPEDPLKDER